MQIKYHFFAKKIHFFSQIALMMPSYSTFSSSRHLVITSYRYLPISS